MTEILDRYEWNDAEMQALESIGYTQICAKISALPDKVFSKLMHYFDAWLDGTAPKARLNYWLGKAGLTVEELNIWCTL